ncbi:heavy metal translocating P-type ATPase [Sphingomonas sp. AR_OL41]|uniref:heavy metal translocating P-type ATPase n=1 Tax=Sphingomonas sp. AR_OL41 TaxID=3042729 RepID=UPI00247FA74F|nr:heavy metal translocating P-type ATPase [Sphingomonas sp. AR_OL41]MDH7970958.1 heavy metal translocating P-type ATPase [Sphingomonas sp. AR_OL41]
MTALAPIGPGEAAVRSTFAVEGLRCAGCIAKLEGALGAMPGVIAARVNFGAGRVTVEHLDAPDEDALCAAIDALGFRAHVFAGEVETAGDAESRALLLALAVAGFAAMNIMLLSVAIWSGAEGSTRILFHWLSALIALPTIAYAGRPFFRSAWRALSHGTTNMDVPISIGVVLTAAMSLYETATGGAHAYFDGAVMLLFFLLAGRALDSVMRARARDGVAALLRRVPRDALVLLPDGTTQRRQAEELAPGMRVLVAAGERIGVDGKVEQGDSSVDRALVTGESLPERVMIGSAVLAGTINLSAPLVVRATATGASTAIADIARLMDSAGQGKSRYVRIADRASRLYAPAVHTLAALTLVGRLLAGAGLHASLMTAVAVLIITCPCALGLAVPIAQVVAAGSLLRAGVLIKDGSALERLATVDRVLLDKTGTVTLGRLQPDCGLPGEATERGILLTLARSSRHPLSRAIAAALDDTVASEALADIVEHPGLGVEAMLGDERVRLGRADWVLGETGVGGASATEAVFRVGAAPAHHIIFSDTPRPDARAAIDRLTALGLAPSFVSGDSAVVVDRLAATLGMPGRARLSPADKHDAVAALEQDGHHVLMVGDGLNDGPALRRASVAMAPASASDVGQMAADAVFLGEALMPVPLAIVAARRTMAVVRQNFALAIGYNLLAVPVAMAGMVTPLIAALAMSGSSLLVVANALRLRGAAR